MKPEETAQRALTAGLATSVLLFVLGLASYLATGCNEFPERILLTATVTLVATPFLTLVSIIAAHIARREFYNAAAATLVAILMLLSVALGLKH